MENPNIPFTRACFLASSLFYMIQCCFAADPMHGKLIFEDAFDRSESQETKDEVGNGWTTNSDRRAGGNKQVDLKDGAIYITKHPTADHAVTVAHDAEFQDGTVEIKFMLENANDLLGIDFADLKYKDVHAGHLFKVDVGLNKVLTNDTKTGIMDLKIREQRMTDALTPEQQKVLDTKKKSLPVKLHTKSMYTISIQVAGETVTISIDGKPIGSHTSAGYAHTTKRMIRLSVPRQAVVDDVKIYSASTP